MPTTGWLRWMLPLLTIDTPAIVRAIEDNPEDREAWKGAVRYFAGWDFRPRRGSCSL
jgi:hypothetical protein